MFYFIFDSHYRSKWKRLSFFSFLFDQPFSFFTILANQVKERKRLGQTSIQFAGAFIIFISVVIYIAFSVIAQSGEYEAKIKENVLREEAWLFSNYVLENVSSGKSIDEQKVGAYFGKCTEADTSYHENAKELFNVSNERSFFLTISKNPVALTTVPSGNNFIGDLEIESINCAITTSKSTQTSDYDRAAASCGTPSSPRAVGEEILINNVKYAVSRIDQQGQFAILINKTVSCGIIPPAFGKTIVSIERFLPYDGHLGSISILFW